MPFAPGNSNQISTEMQPTILVYKYLTANNKFDMEGFRNEWNKELDHPVMPEQWDTALKCLPALSVNSKLQLIQQ